MAITIAVHGGIAAWRDHVDPRSIVRVGGAQRGPTAIVSGSDRPGRMRQTLPMAII